MSPSRSLHRCSRAARAVAVAFATATALAALTPAAAWAVAVPAASTGDAGISAAASAAETTGPEEATGVWVVPGAAKVFPDTPPGPQAAVDLSAAANEYEAAQIAVSLPGAGPVTLSWSPDSDALLTANTNLMHVGYVMITKPSTGIGSRPGPYPDPLLPLAFGTAVDLPAGSSSFYLRVHVPLDTAAGTYHGTVTVRGHPADVQVPVSLHVWDFGWTRPSLHTSFAMSLAKVMDSVAGVVPDTPENEARLTDAYYRFFAEHWLSPKQLRPRPVVDRDSGRLDTTGLADLYGPYLGLPGGDEGLFWDSAYQLDGGFPFGDIEPEAERPQLEAYLRDLLGFSLANGWERRSYFYAFDEPGYGAELKAEALARMVHDASDELGFRARFMLTDWPRPRAIGDRQANGFLFDDVDIWCPSVYRYFLAQPALDDRRADGADVWMYTYASWNADRYPTFLIDEPLGEERGFVWMTWRYGATGILYWGTTRWGDPITGDGYRDPYANPVSWAYRNGWVSNGDACLIYPGYYPALGLDDPWAPPVSSLRLEALRDGIEDYEYLRLASRARTGDAAATAAAQAAAAVAAAITEYPYGAYPQDYRNIPSLSSDPYLYVAARAHLASYIERADQGLAPVETSGQVVDAATGKPVAAARVSDGVVSTTTARDGSFTLKGVLSPATITASHPLYGRAKAEALEGAPLSPLALQRRPSSRLLAGFEGRPLFRVNRGFSTTSRAWSTSGAQCARLVLRGSGATATLSLSPRSRDLRRATSLELDVRYPAEIDHARQWFVRLSARDARGRAVSRRFLLAPLATTHLSLSLRQAGLDRAHVAAVTLTLEGSSGQTLLVDTLAVR